MAALLGTTAYTAQIVAVGVEVGIIGAAASLVILGIWGIKKSRAAV
ncbi:MAG: hypothetical protein ABL856_01605 [Gallionella sp.]